MNRLLTVAVIVAVLAGTVPAAATLADGTPSDAEPGAAFSGTIGVQEAEVNNEVAARSLGQRLQSAETNESKATVVANETEQLQDRLTELEAQKEQVKQAYENGSISKGEYQARLAVLGAELRAVERQATQTADVAEKLPKNALREKGANASEVRKIAHQANRSGGGEVAEAARNIAGGGVGNGLGNAPNGSERGPPTDVGNGAAPNTGENSTDGRPTDAGPPSDAGNNPANASDGTERGQDTGAASNRTAHRNDTEPGADGNAANRSTEAANGSSAASGTGSAATGTDQSPNETATETAGEDDQSSIGIGTGWLSGDVSVGGALAGPEDTLPDVTGTILLRTTLR